MNTIHPRPNPIVAAMYTLRDLDVDVIIVHGPAGCGFMASRMLEEAGFNVLDVLEHYFKPQGYTALYLLSESHFAVHTFPEFGKTYIELSSCNLEYYQRFIELTKDM